MPRTNIFLALALSLTVAACDEAADADDGDGDDIAVRPGFGGSGLKLNTNAIGDHLLHELNIKGDLHEDVVLDGVYLKKTYKFQVTWLRLDHVWVEQGELFGKLGDVVYKGAELHGSRWDILTYGGGVKYREMYLHSSRYDKVDDIHKYTFGYPPDPAYGPHLFAGKKGNPIDGSGLMAACDNDENGNLEAVLYEDLHVDMKSGAVKKMSHLINIACTAGGVGKAGLWGYRSYELGYEEFEAAVRMVRADYCGDGDSYTKPGTKVDIEDRWGINKFVDPNSKLEALWSPKGAMCVYATRSSDVDFEDVSCGAPMKMCEGDETLASSPNALMMSNRPN